jgi:hypothetical protein
VYGPAQGEVAHQAQEGAEVGFCEDDLERGGGTEEKDVGMLPGIKESDCLLPEFRISAGVQNFGCS